MGCYIRERAFQMFWTPVPITTGDRLCWQWELESTTSRGQGAKDTEASLSTRKGTQHAAGGGCKNSKAYCNQIIHILNSPGS